MNRTEWFSRLTAFSRRVRTCQGTTFSGEVGGSLATFERVGNLLGIRGDLGECEAVD